MVPPLQVSHRGSIVRGRKELPKIQRTSLACCVCSGSLNESGELAYESGRDATSASQPTAIAEKAEEKRAASLGFVLSAQRAAAVALEAMRHFARSIPSGPITPLLYIPISAL